MPGIQHLRTDAALRGGCASKMPRIKNLAITVLLLAAVAAAQVATPPQPRPTSPPGPLANDMDRLQAAAREAEFDISHLRIDRWKVDNDSKRQEQANAESLQRNLTSALPGLIENYRANPNDLNASFKLYRNLNALYDVFSGFTESVGAFGPKADYDALAQQLNIIDAVRRDLADNLESATASTAKELNSLRAQVHTLQQSAAAAPPPKKVVVDNSESPKKTTRKKKPASTSTTEPSTSGSTSTPKPQ